MPLVAASLFMVTACTDSPTAPTPSEDSPTGMEDAAVAATFTQVQKQIFDLMCVNCHGALSQAGLDLRSPQSHSNLVNVTSSISVMVYVVPGNPDASYLIHKLDGRDGIIGSRKPQLGDPLPAELLELVRSWIQAGALDKLG